MVSSCHYLLPKPQLKRFTFMEIMVTVTIMALVFIPMISFFTKTQLNFQKGAQIQDSLLSASTLMRQLKADLKSATAFGKEGGIGTFRINVEDDGSVTGMSFPIFTGERAKSTLGKSVSHPLLARVEYELIADFGGKLGKKISVKRKITPHKLDKVTQAGEHIIAKNIISFRVFEYSMYGVKYFRIHITGYSNDEILGAETTVQLFTSVAVRFFSSKEVDDHWNRIETNKPILDE